jgi:hypothetical protein
MALRRQIATQFGYRLIGTPGIGLLNANTTARATTVRCQPVKGAALKGALLG